MIRIKPHVRSTGSGPDVVLFHSSGSSGRQWDALSARLAGRFRIHAVDLHGHGRTAAWPHASPMRLMDEVELVEPLLQQLGEMHLVGHSYGGAVALKIASLHPNRVLSVSVYEPVLFRLLFDYQPRDRAATEVKIVATSIRNWLQLGYTHRAAERFVDFWSGAGTWDVLPEDHQAVVASRMPVIAQQFHALFNDTLDMPMLQQIDVPVLSMSGQQTRAATRRLTELLRVALPRASHRVLPGLGHMGPVTHADVVNSELVAYLERQASVKTGRELLQAA